MRRYVFAYGSLLNAKSLANTIARTPLDSEFIEVEISGYEQIWGYSAPVFFNDDFTSSGNLNIKSHNSSNDDQNSNSVAQNAIFLTIIKNPHKSAFGALIEISGNEFAKLVKREKDYEVLTISHEQVRGENIKDYQIYTFGTLQKPQINGVIPNLYIELINSAIEKFTPKFQEKYKKAVLLNLPFIRKDGNYSFSNIEQNLLAKGQK